MSETPTIIYTHTDEAPALATRSFLPVIRTFLEPAGIAVETRDISLSGRILAAFPEWLNEDQRVPDHLAELGELAKTPGANIIKLPNISASIPQLKDAIAELRSQGYDLPEYPEEPDDEHEEAIKARYDSVKGSAVNPVLREGNSDRRAPKAVKDYARAHPHRLRAWDSESKAHVSSMTGGDFFGNEQSTTIGDAATTARIEHIAADGEVTVLKEGIALEAGEIIDATFMSAKALGAFLAEQVIDARERGVLFSLHMKATMMKVSDPIIFGHAVRAFFASVFEKHAGTFERLGVDPSSGFADVIKRIADLPEAERTAIEADIAAVYEAGPGIAMVDSDRGITNLHVPNDIIIDASMPVMIRDGGKMWNAAGELQDAKAVIPDRSYAGVYQAVVEDCIANGPYDPTTMGSVPNVGLMAKKAEEYGSHDKTFTVSAEGTMRVVDADGATLTEHTVEAGDIWRMCQVKDGPIRDWVQLAIRRAKATGSPAVFWLNRERAHDAQLLAKLDRYLDEYGASEVETHVLAPADAATFSVERIRRGEDTISVTGNVLRDYLTDLFPILEVGTSAKMLSIVPLMNGGGLFETGAGGSAPKHVQQFEKENHLRWDSLGEFLALSASLEHLAEHTGTERARVIADALDTATTRYLQENRSPSRKVGEPGNRNSHAFMAVAWARALADQTRDADLAGRFRELADELDAAAETISKEIIDAEGQPMDIGGYFHPDEAKAVPAMRPSPTLNAILDKAAAAV